MERSSLAVLLRNDGHLDDENVGVALQESHVDYL
jgi:hypothetical protein